MCPYPIEIGYAAEIGSDEAIDDSSQANALRYGNSRFHLSSVGGQRRVPPSLTQKQKKKKSIRVPLQQNALFLIPFTTVAEAYNEVLTAIHEIFLERP